MKKGLLLLIICFGVFSWKTTCAQKAENTYVEFDLPAMIWFTAEERQSIQSFEMPGRTELMTHLLQTANEALIAKPDPLDSLFYEGHVSNHPLRIKSARHLQDMIHLRALTWAYIFTGEKKYAKKARSFLWAWASTYLPTGNDVNENKLTGCFLAYDIFRNDLPRGKRKQIEAWIDAIALRQQEGWRLGEWAGNRHIKRLKIILLAGLARDREDVKTFALERAEEVLKKALFPDGTTHDLKRRSAMHYHVSMLNGMLEFSLIARATGTDYYRWQTPSGASLQKSVAYVLPYAKREKVHKEWLNSKVKLDHKRWEAGDPYYRPGKPWDPLEAIKMLTMASVYEPHLSVIATDLKNEKKAENIDLFPFQILFLSSH